MSGRPPVTPWTYGGLGITPNVLRKKAAGAVPNTGVNMNKVQAAKRAMNARAAEAEEAKAAALGAAAAARGKTKINMKGFMEPYAARVNAERSKTPLGVSWLHYSPLTRVIRIQLQIQL